MTELSKDALDELAMLLPMYVNGDVTQDEKRQIETALSQSETLRSELEDVRQSMSIVEEFGQSLSPVSDTENRLAPLLARLGAQEEDQSLAPKFWSTVSEKLDTFLARFAKPALAASLAVIVLQSFLLTRPDEVSYQPLSGPEATETDQMSQALLQFAPDATAADIEAMLTYNSMTIISGPNNGFFVIASRAQGADFEALLERISQTPIVELALPRNTDFE